MIWKFCQDINRMNISQDIVNMINTQHLNSQTTHSMLTVIIPLCKDLLYERTEGKHYQEIFICLVEKIAVVNNINMISGFRTWWCYLWLLNENRIWLLNINRIWLLNKNRILHLYFTLEFSRWCIDTCFKTACFAEWECPTCSKCNIIPELSTCHKHKWLLHNQKEKMVCTLIFLLATHWSCCIAILLCLDNRIWQHISLFCDCIWHICFS